MKKLLAITLAAALTLALAGCWGNDTGDGSDMSAIGYKVGMASYTTTEDSYGYTEGKNGRGAVSTTYVTAVFDENGIIKKVYIDKVETKLYFDKTGQLADYTAGEVRSKRELGDAYGMKAYSGIGKEWYEQIDSLESYLEGKDVNTIIGTAESRIDNYSRNAVSTINSDTVGTANSDINSGTMSDGGVPNVPNGGVAEGETDHTSGIDVPSSNVTDGTSDWMGDVTASVTIDTSNIQKAIRKAYENAK